MAEYVTTDTELTSIANAIRTKGGTSAQLEYPDEFVDAIDAIQTGSTINNQNKSVTPTESQQTVTADSGYTGLGTVTVGAIDSEYVGSNVTRRSSSDLTANGATVTAPAGYYGSAASKAVSTTTHADPSVSVNTTTGLITASHTQTAGYVSAGTTTKTSQLSTQAATTITPTESEQTAVAANKYTLGAVTVGAISSTYVGSGITQRDSTDLTASGATVSVPSGYYASSASKAVASGTAGTPTATKGAVSNHSVSVTPSVTNTAGYITGGTKTGTAVSVSASELVSGSQNITTNATYDVTNLASVVVNVPGGGGGATNIVAGTFTTSSTLGSVQEIAIPYTGTGYPIAGTIFPTGGIFGNSTFNNLVQRYAIGQLAWSKLYTTTTPDYSLYIDDNMGNLMMVYKGTSATSYSAYSTRNPYLYSSAAPSATTTDVIKFSDAVTMKIYVANASYGLKADLSYDYVILYSS